MHKRRMWTYDKVKKYIEDIGYILISKEYKNNKQKLLLKDKVGYYYISSINRLLKNHIPWLVHLNNPYTIQNIKLWCKLNDKPFELVSMIYETNKKKLKWKCLKEKCGEIFEATWGNIISNKGCSYCAGKQVGLSNCLATNNPELAAEWHPTKNGELTPYDVTLNSGQYIWWECKECGHEWVVRVADRNNGTNCPKCNESKGESKIDHILNSLNLIHAIQYTFPVLLSDKRKLLRFDFAVFNKYNKLMCLIEYDGHQHFKPIRFGGISMEKAIEIYKTTVKYDIRKNLYCAKNNIPLIRIPYWEFDNIEMILVETFKDVSFLLNNEL